MKKVLLIGSGLAVVGGLAYLYLKNKKKEEAILTGGTSATQPIATTPIATTPTGATSSATDGGLTGGSVVVTSKTTASNSEEQAKLDTAKDIEAKIKKYYILSASQQRLNLMKPQGIFASPISSNFNANTFLIKKLKDDLKTLGYEYKGQIDGFLVKI